MVVVTMADLILNYNGSEILRIIIIMLKFCCLCPIS